jgi:hypothetical protein
LSSAFEFQRKALFLGDDFETTKTKRTTFALLDETAMWNALGQRVIAKSQVVPNRPANKFLDFIVDKGSSDLERSEVPRLEG